MKYQIINRINKSVSQKIESTSFKSVGIEDRRIFSVKVLPILHLILRSKTISGTVTDTRKVYHRYRI